MMMGDAIYDLAKVLWPINRSITGNGNRQTLKILKEICPSINIFEVPSGTKVFDWVIPDEWNVSEAWIKDPDGNRIVDFARNNLHLVSYSVPTDCVLSLEELEGHLYSRSDLPTAIPYVTSYYNSHWGFCISQEQRKNLKKGNYHVHIDVSLQPGFLTYGELIIPGETDKEVFISTYICHPSMANNELSGPTVTVHLGKWLESLPHRHYTYRIVFVPETIGSLTYLSLNLDCLQKNVIAGFNVSCVGDDRVYSYLPSRFGDTLSDDIAKHVLKWLDPNYIAYTWNDRASDERQYCAPGIDLPVASISRSKCREYPEYHTSLDDLENVVSPQGLQGGFDALKLALEAVEANCFPESTILGEPNLGKRGLYPTIGAVKKDNNVRLIKNFLSYSDGRTSLLKVAQKCSVPIWELYPVFNTMLEHGLIKRHNHPVYQGDSR